MRYLNEEVAMAITDKALRFGIGEEKNLGEANKRFYVIHF